MRNFLARDALLTKIRDSLEDGGGSSDKDNRDISVLGVPPDEVRGRGRRTHWRTTAAAGAQVLIITNDCRVALAGSLNILVTHFWFFLGIISGSDTMWLSKPSVLRRNLHTSTTRTMTLKLFNALY